MLPKLTTLPDIIKLALFIFVLVGNILFVNYRASLDPEVVSSLIAVLTYIIGLLSNTNGQSNKDVD